MHLLEKTLFSECSEWLQQKSQDFSITRQNSNTLKTAGGKTRYRSVPSYEEIKQSCVILLLFSSRKTSLKDTENRVLIHSYGAPEIERKTLKCISQKNQVLSPKGQIFCSRTSMQFGGRLRHRVNHQLIQDISLNQVVYTWAICSRMLSGTSFKCSENLSVKHRNPSHFQRRDYGISQYHPQAKFQKSFVKTGGGGCWTPLQSTIQYFYQKWF